MKDGTDKSPGVVTCSVCGKYFIPLSFMQDTCTSCTIEMGRFDLED